MKKIVKRFLICLKFKGTFYCGWQVQKNGISIQQVVQNAIEKILKCKTNVVACSRTDSGVHAENFYLHIDLTLNINPNKFKYALNLNLPNDIAVNFVKIVSNHFHARYGAQKKEYIYRIWNSKTKNPFLDKLAWHYYRKLNLEKMQLASNFLIGTFDFSAFCCARSKTKNKIRTIFDIKIKKNNKLIEVQIVGNGFLHNMVRIIVGTLIEVSENLISIEDIPKILISKNRQKAGRTLPACGLYLKQVFY